MQFMQRVCTLHESLELTWLLGNPRFRGSCRNHHVQPRLELIDAAVSDGAGGMIEVDGVVVGKSRGRRRRNRTRRVFTGGLHRRCSYHGGPEGEKYVCVWVLCVVCVR